jgi:ATP-dependent DNA helicase PIF1
LADNSISALINALYPGITQGGHPDKYFLDRTILCPKNDAVDELNQSILDRFPGQQTVITSVDKVIGPMQNVYPLEYLHKQNASGLPLAHLALKPGCPLMLLGNLDVTNGLCNGTRMILLQIQPRVLECRILGGKHSGKVVFIPRITLEPSAEDLAIPLSRRQFPVCLAFSMTINKSQGQSVINVGLDLRVSVFSHGQLYVALSRCTSGDRIKVLFPDTSDDTTTPNIVHRELLNDIIDPWYVVSLYFLDLLIDPRFSLDLGLFFSFSPLFFCNT